MADSPNQPNVVYTAPLTWRKHSPLHQAAGAQSSRGLLALAANVPFVLARFQYGPDTVDRIIGVYLNFKTNVPPGVLTITELNTSWELDIKATSQQFGAYYFNIETLTDGVNLQLLSTIALTGNYSLYNFEISPHNTQQS